MKKVEIIIIINANRPLSDRSKTNKDANENPRIVKTTMNVTLTRFFCNNGFIAKSFNK